MKFAHKKVVQLALLIILSPEAPLVLKKKVLSRETLFENRKLTVEEAYPEKFSEIRCRKSVLNCIM